MNCLKRMGITTVVMTAALAHSAGFGPGCGISPAADPPPGAPDPAAARKAAIARQQAKKQQQQATRQKRLAQRRLAEKATAQKDAAFAAGINPWSGGGFAGGNSAFGASSLSSGGTTAAGGATTGARSTAANGQDSLALNAGILEFAVNHLGQQVGNGECWTLAADALIYAGAKPAVGYTFGDMIPLSSAQPGDILQFESALFVTPTSWILMGDPHHTAIVDAVQGTQFVVLQQNFNGIRQVQMMPIDMATLISGTVTAFRAVANTTTPIQ